MAQQLQALGISRVRPLEGGFRRWKALGFPLQDPTEVDWKTASSMVD